MLKLYMVFHFNCFAKVIYKYMYNFTRHCGGKIVKGFQGDASVKIKVMSLK